MPTLYLKRTFRLKEPSGSQKKNFNDDNNNDKKFKKKVIHALFLSEMY